MDRYLPDVILHNTLLLTIKQLLLHTNRSPTESDKNVMNRMFFIEDNNKDWDDLSSVKALVHCTERAEMCAFLCLFGVTATEEMIA